MSESLSTVGTNKPTAFVVMCFDTRLHHIYQKVVKPVLGKRLECIRADEICSIGIVIDDIRNQIDKAHLIFCDLTYDNPNVFYEIGFAHALNKPTIMISQNPANIPFDVRHYRIIGYEDTKVGLLDLRESLEKAVQSMVTDYPDRPIDINPNNVLPKNELAIQRDALFSSSLEFKRYAIKFIGDCNDAESFEKIKSITQDDNNPSDILRDAFTALHKIDANKARHYLLNEGLRYQKHLLVRERVVNLLGNYLLDDALLDQMRKQLGDSSWGVRKAVCEVLGRWGDASAISALQSIQSDSESQVRFAASEALERISLKSATRTQSESSGRQTAQLL